MKWHSTVREQLVRMGAGSEVYDAKWGRLLLSNVFNVDQSPLPFVVDSKKIYEIIKSGDKHQKTQISQRASGL